MTECKIMCLSCLQIHFHFNLTEINYLVMQHNWFQFRFDVVQIRYLRSVESKVQGPTNKYWRESVYVLKHCYTEQRDPLSYIYSLNNFDVGDLCVIFHCEYLKKLKDDKGITPMQCFLAYKGVKYSGQFGSRPTGNRRNVHLSSIAGRQKHSKKKVCILAGCPAAA